jgi:hypothetical protein
MNKLPVSLDKYLNSIKNISVMNNENIKKQLKRKISSG